VVTYEISTYPEIYESLNEYFPGHCAEKGVASQVSRVYSATSGYGNA
jgi:hypothetical protein